MRRRFARAADVAALLALGVAALLGTAAAQARDDSPITLTDSLRLDPLVHMSTLPNGIRAYVRRNGKPESRVSLRLVVRVGSIAEKDDEQGLAHFIEHMNFNGSEHFQPGEMFAYLRSIGLRIGADANAYTSFEETVYMLDVPTDRDTLLDRGFLALADFAGRALLSPAEVEKERGVVLEEWRLGQGAGERIQRQQIPVLYRGSRYAERLPIGKPEIIRTAPSTRLSRFYHDWYTPDRFGVVAVGDLDPASADSLIRVHFGDLSGAAASRQMPAAGIPPHRETLVSVATDREATGSSVSLLYEHPRRSRARVQDFRVGLTENLFHAMLNDRLDELAHSTDPPFLGAGASSGGLNRDTEFFGLDASVADGGIPRGLEALANEVQRIRRHGFLASELERAKSELMSQIERGYAERDKSDSRLFASQIVNHFLTGDPVPGIETAHRLARALIPEITLDDVHGLLARLVHDHDRVVLAVAPEKHEIAVPSADTLSAIVDRGSAATVAAWQDTASGRSLADALPPPGAVRDRRSIDSLGVTVLTLANGVEVWLKPTDFKADEIVFNGAAPGGASLADSADYVAASFSASVVRECGLGGFTRIELGKLLAGKLASSSPYVDDYLHGVAGQCRPEDLETALQLAALCFAPPTEDSTAFVAMKQRLRAYLLDRANSPDAVFADSVNALNTGRFFMDRPLTLADVDRLRLADALGFYRERFANAADLAFFFAGNFSVDSIAPLVARYLGGLPSQGRATSRFVERVPHFPDRVERLVVRKGSEPKASVALTFFADTRLDELEMHRARAASSILAERLREILRENLGATYGVSVGYSDRLPAKGYGTIGVGFGGAPENVERMIAATRKEIERLRAEGPAVSDVEKLKEIERRELETEMKRNGTWVGLLRTFHVLGWDPLRILERRERIDRLDAESLRETFRKYFPIERHTEAMLLPENAAPAGKKAAAGKKASLGTRRSPSHAAARPNTARAKATGAKPTGQR